jgi:predicted nucleic acid-binding protein
MDRQHIDNNNGSYYTNDMPKETTVIVDADGLIALFNKDDPNHKRAVRISNLLLKQNATVLIPITALSEAITTTKWKKDRPDLVKMLVDMSTNGSMKVIEISPTLLPLASSYFKPDGSKHNTFFDAIIAAITTQQHAQAIFSFDKWYTKQGFTLANDLIEHRNN